VARPLELGGLGVLNLTMMGYALMLRWECLARTDPDRMSSVITSKPERIVCAMYEASTSVQVDNGRQTLFWADKWIDGESVAQLAPALFSWRSANKGSAPDW
jgi:hypothetical protein